MKLRNALMVDETFLCKENFQNDYFLIKKSLVNANDLLDAFNPTCIVLFYPISLLIYIRLRERFGVVRVITLMRKIKMITPNNLS